MWTKPHSCSKAHQNGALPLNGYFHEAESLLFFFLSQLPWFNAFNAGWCSIQIVFNALHLPTNHKTIKTEKERNSETHYAFLSDPFPSVLPSLERTSSPLWTPLSPLWVSTFTENSQITSHALWSVGVVILFSMRLFINLWFSLICLCSMFVRFFFFFGVFHDAIKVGFLILRVNLCGIWIYVWVYFSFFMWACLTDYDYAHELLFEMRQWV